MLAFGADILEFGVFHLFIAIQKIDECVEVATVPVCLTKSAPLAGFSLRTPQAFGHTVSLGCTSRADLGYYSIV